MSHQFFINGNNVFLIVFNLVQFDLNTILYWRDSIILTHRTLGFRNSPLIFLVTLAISISNPHLCTLSQNDSQVGTHSDATSKQQIGAIQEKLVNHFNTEAEFIAISCLMKDSISHLQNRILARAQQVGLIGQPIPSNFKNLQDALRGVQKPLIPWQQFQSILEEVLLR